MQTIGTVIGQLHVLHCIQGLNLITQECRTAARAVQALHVFQRGLNQPS